MKNGNDSILYKYCGMPIVADICSISSLAVWIIDKTKLPDKLDTISVIIVGTIITVIYSIILFYAVQRMWYPSFIERRVINGATHLFYRTYRGIPFQETGLVTILYGNNQADHAVAVAQIQRVQENQYIQILPILDLDTETAQKLYNNDADVISRTKVVPGFPTVHWDSIKSKMG